MSCENFGRLVVTYSTSGYNILYIIVIIMKSDSYDIVVLFLCMHNNNKNQQCICKRLFFDFFILGTYIHLRHYYHIGKS